MKVGVFPIINNTHACCLLSFPPSSSLPPLVYLARSGSPSRAFPSLTPTPHVPFLFLPLLRVRLSPLPLSPGPHPRPPRFTSLLSRSSFSRRRRLGFGTSSPATNPPGMPRPLLFPSRRAKRSAPNPTLSYSCSDLTQLFFYTIYM